MSPQLRQSLAALIQAYDQGLGPVERAARERRATGAPMTDPEIATVAEIHYPVEVRSFLLTHGQQALMREDLARALAASAPAVSSPSGSGSAAKAGRRRAKRRALAATALRLAVLAAAVAAGGLILHVGLPKIRAERASPEPVPTAVEAPAPAPAPVRPVADSPCRQALRDDAAAWCEGALTGTRARGPIAETPGVCGDPLAAKGDTVRQALNGLLDNGMVGSYGPAEARERCKAAADLAVPR